MNAIQNRKERTLQLIREAHSEEFTEKYEKFILNDSSPITKSAQTVLQNIPKAFGMCVTMSAHLCALLTDSYKLPAVVVAGDLSISGIHAFQTTERIQQSSLTDVIVDDWQGHSWVEIGGLIVDISIGRTADLAPNGSNLKAFIHNKFGKGKGLFAFPAEYAYSLNMLYVPKEVLSDSTITAVIKGYHS